MSIDDNRYTIKVEVPKELRDPQGKDFLEIAIDGFADMLSTISHQLRSQGNNNTSNQIANPEDSEQYLLDQDQACDKEDPVVYKDSCQDSTVCGKDFESDEE
jgi:predicted nucleic acid-binding protein